MITFAEQQFPGDGGYMWISVKKGATPLSIAGHRGHPEQAQAIAKLNHVAAHYKFKTARKVKIPKSLRAGDTFDVMADDATAPTVTDGYAILQVVARPGLIGISQFQGYNPLAMDVAVRFEATDKSDGSGVESDIATLERMAGRGNFSGAGNGPPSVIRLSTTDNNGNVVPLIPLNYQWNAQNKSAPLWRIEAIQWNNQPWRNRAGRRVRQLAVVTVWEYTPVVLQVALSARSKAKKKKSAVKK